MSFCPPWYTFIMQCHLESYNSNKLVHEINEKLKDRSNNNSKMFLVSKHDKHSGVLEPQDSETCLNKSKECNKSSTPINKSRFKPFKSLFGRESKSTIRSHKGSLQCGDRVENSNFPPPTDQGEPYNEYYVHASDDKPSPPNFISRNVDSESDIYEDVSELLPVSESCDKSSPTEYSKEAYTGSENNVNAVRPIPVSQVCPARKRKPRYVTIHGSPANSKASSELELDIDKSWGHSYDSLSINDDFNPAMASSLCKAEPVPVLPNVPRSRKLLQADSCVIKKPPTALPRAACITRSSSKKIHQEWCKLKNDPTFQPDKPVIAKPLPPVPAQRRPSSLPPTKELPEIEEELKLFRALLKQQKDVDITEIVIGNINFTGRMLDSRGGCLQLKSHGVVLYIPPDALGDEPQEIFIYVQQNLKSSHNIVKDGFVSPIVHCGTSGLRFKVPVILTYPVHVKDSSQWELTGIRQDSSTKPWANISDDSTDTVLLNGNLCTVVVDHFTGFGTVGRPQKSQDCGVLPLRVGVFISQNEAIDPVHGCLQLRVRIWDESPETDELIKKIEKGSKLLDTSRRFFLHTSECGTHDADLDVTVALKSLNKPWKTSFRNLIFSLARFEVYHQVDESCTLNLKVRPQDAATDSEYQQGHRPLECDISICQSSFEDFAVTVCAVDEIDVRSGRESAGQRNRIDRVDGFYPMSPGRYRELSSYLDSERRWKLLVKPCFIGEEAKQDFDKYPNPSSVLLGIIFSQGSMTGSSKMTLEKLRSMLSECKLVRAAEIVLKDIDECSGKENGCGFVSPIQCSDNAESFSEAKLHRSKPTSATYNNDLYETIGPPSDATNHVQDRQQYDTANGMQSLCEVTPIRSVPTFVENHDELYEEVSTDGQNEREPEENDEFPDQIHTLQSSQLLQTNTGPYNSVSDGSIHFERQKPQPTQDNWPSGNSKEDKKFEELYYSVPQNNNHYQNMPLKPIANVDTSSYVSLGTKK